MLADTLASSAWAGRWIDWIRDPAGNTLSVIEQPVTT